MTDKLFNKLWKDALAQPDKELYIAEYGYPEFFDEISENLQEIVDVLGNIHDVAWMSFRDILKRSGMTQAEFSTKFCIPVRTIENWSTEKNVCRDYDRLMMARILGFLEV